MIDNRLTILLTLKGRPLHTLRWLWHADKIKLPFKVYIADGEVDDKLAELLESKKFFKNVNYQYHRYDDASLLHYYQKCADAVKKIDTPYVMMADNDDFIFPSGITKSLDFLDAEKDYVCSQGGISGFGVVASQSPLSKIVGKITKFSYRYSVNYESRDCASPLALERLLEQVHNYHPIFYSAIRKEALAKVTSEIVEFNFSSMQIHELYWTYRTATLGKIKSTDKYLSHMRQKNTSLRNPKHDWFWYLVRCNYTEEFKVITSFLSRETKLTDNNNDVNTEELFRNAFADYLRTWVVKAYSEKALTIKARLKRKFKHLNDPDSKKDFYKKLNEVNNSDTIKLEIQEVANTLSDSNLLVFLNHFMK